MPTILVHVQNEDAILCEIDNLPGASDTLLTIKNPRRKDGKDISYIEPSVTTIIWPISRISFIEILPGAEEEEVISFVRE